MASSPRPAQNKLMSRGVMPWLAVTALLLTLTVGGYVFFQNQADSQSSNVTDTTSPSTPSTEDPIDGSPGEQPTDSQSLALEDWGVKFSIPSSLRDTEVIYAKRISNDEPPREYYTFTTKRIQELGGKCEEQPFGDTITLGRYTEKPYAVPHGELINENPINNYYYATSGPIMACSGFDEEGNMQHSSSVETKDRESLKELLRSLHDV